MYPLGMARASCRRRLSWLALWMLQAACAPNDDQHPEPSSSATHNTSNSNTSGDADSTSTTGGAEATSNTETSGRETGGATDGFGGSGSFGGSAGFGASSGAAVTSGATGNAAAGGEATLGSLTLYYLDVTEDRVMALAAAGGPPELVVEGAGEGPDGIAVDAVAGHLYWTNMGVPADDDGFILRSDLDGSNVTTIVEPGDTYTPKQLKLDPEAGKLYWGDREGMQVMRSNLDGTELEVLVTIAEGETARADRTNHAVGVAVDPAGGYFYWIQKGPPNGGEGSIRRAQLELPNGENDRTRTDIEIVYAGLPEPIDLDLDVGAGMMYWTDRGDATINRAPVEIPGGTDPDAREDREVLLEGVDVAIGIWLDLPAGHVYYTGTDVVGRVDLDGRNDTVLVRNAGVLTGITGARRP